jgi:hypothetical protein
MAWCATHREVIAAQRIVAVHLARTCACVSDDVREDVACLWQWVGRVKEGDLVSISLHFFGQMELQMVLTRAPSANRHPPTSFHLFLFPTTIHAPTHRGATFCA